MKAMRFFTLLSIVLLSSCVLTGSGIRALSGTVVGGVPANIKIGLFPPGDQFTFSHDHYNDADKDVVFQNAIGDETGGGAGSFSPQLVTVPDGSGNFSLLLPEDPSAVNCLIAWTDADSDGIFDLGTGEIAYLPVKIIDGKDYAVHRFSYLEETPVLIYIAVYSTMDRNDAYYDLNAYEPRQDSLDTIGGAGFLFRFD